MHMRKLATVWEGCFGSISAVAVTGSIPWRSFRDALSPCIEDYQFPKSDYPTDSVYDSACRHARPLRHGRETHVLRVGGGRHARWCPAATLVGQRC